MANVTSQMCRYGDSGAVERGLCLYHLWLTAPLRDGRMFGKDAERMGR